MRHRDDRPLSTGWVLPVSALTLLLIVGGSGITLADLLVADDAQESTVSLRGAVAASPSPTAADPGPSATTPESALIAAARRVKPLEDIEKGDRVIYQEHVCVWLLWDKNINTSTIRCPGQRAFQIQTGRLTPVERKDGASRLTVEQG